MLCDQPKLKPEVLELVKKELAEATVRDEPIRPFLNRTFSSICMIQIESYCSRSSHGFRLELVAEGEEGGHTL